MYFKFLKDAFKPTSDFLKPQLPIESKPSKQDLAEPVSAGWVSGPMAGGIRALVKIQVGNVSAQFPHCRFSTGSSISYIGTSDLRTLGISSITKLPPNFAATDATGGQTPFRGFFEGEVTFNGRKSTVRFYVSTEADSPCLGFSAIRELVIAIGACGVY